MSVDSLRNNLTNPARAYLWEVVIPTPLAGETEDYLLRAQSTSLPERSFGEILIPYKQSAGIKFPGKLTYSHTWDLTFIENEDREVLTSFYEWCNQIIDDRLNTGSVTIKTDVYLHLLNTDGEVALRVRLMGCYPQRMSDAPLDYASEDPIRFTVTFSFDRWEFPDV
jgi:hypothetical protein